MGRFLARFVNLRRCAAATVAAIFCAAVSVAQSPTKEEERQRNEEAALAIWPEAADPQSIMGREMKRLLSVYSARKDPRLDLVTAPMWIASQAAANTERQRAASESQQTAMRLYPDLAKLDSPLNKLFRETYGRYKEVKPDYFTDARWPIKLAQQCALQLDAQHAIGSQPPGESARPGSTGLAQIDPNPDRTVEVLPHPARRWVVTAALGVLGVALGIAILTRALRTRSGKDIAEHDEYSI
jgi:hypothetical protein